MKKNVFTLLLFITALPLFAQNHMDILKRLDGEYPHSFYGYTVTALDFNGDGYDDLVTGTPRWSYNHINDSVGRLYCYYGNENGLNSEQDFTITGYRTLNLIIRGYGNDMANLGDMNGDGFEDIGYKYSTIIGSNNSYYISHIAILLGNAVNDSIPDFDFEIPRYYGSDEGELLHIQPLGDINGDGYDDAGFTTKYGLSNEVYQYYYIIYGSSGEMELHLFRHFLGIDFPSSTIHGIGDINCDGYDDFEIGYKHNEDFGSYTNLIYFGDTVIDTIPNYDIVYNSECLNITGITCGDFNGDGKDDFLPSFKFYDPAIYIGNEAGELQYYTSFDPYWGFICIENYAYGDLNGDGKDDIVIGNPTYMDNFGRISITLGSDNGERDMQIEYQEMYNSYGKSVAIGDFNNDGYDDVAVGAPRDSWEDENWPSGINGTVWVYAGNPDLHDTTENTNDEINVVNNVNFKAYPNPFNPVITFSFDINKKSVKTTMVEIYNLKGQKVKNLEVNDKKLGTNKIIWNGKNEKRKPVATGMYMAKLLFDKKAVAYKKITLLK